MFDLNGKTALVTGATSGLGLRFAQVLAKAGAGIALCGRRLDRLQALEAELVQAGHRAKSFVFDVTRPEQIAPILDQVETLLGPVDILINNAGMNSNKRVDQYTVDDFDAVMNTNVKGAFFCAQQVGLRMIKRKSAGRIINIASIGAHTPLPGLTAYCMSKAAIAMMTRSLAKDWARININVNAICPGFILTEINDDWFGTEAGRKQIDSFPRKRIGEAADLDATLLLLAADESRFMTGSLITVDDGQSLG
jgi:NAD(P)-dependent dehydrogenase (short-subunit alcohol dehydrogenase family)